MCLAWIVYLVSSIVSFNFVLLTRIDNLLIKLSSSSALKVKKPVDCIHVGKRLPRLSFLECHRYSPKSVRRRAITLKVTLPMKCWTFLFTFLFGFNCLKLWHFVVIWSSIKQPANRHFLLFNNQVLLFEWSTFVI